MRPKGCWVHPGPLGSLVYALGVVGFIRGGTRVQPGCRWVHPGCLASHGSALGVVGFIRGRWGHSVAPWGSEFILRSWVHSGARFRSSCSSGVVRFTRVSPRCRCVHQKPFASLVYALGVVGFIWGGTRVCPGGRWVYPGPWCSLGCALRDVGFIRGRWGHSDVPWGSLGSSGVVALTRERPGGLCVDAASLVSSGVVWYTRVRR